MEDQAEYITETQDALEMLGKGYHDEPSIELHPQQTVIRRRGREMQEEVIPAFVKISTSFKAELAQIGGTALKVWLFIALSINRTTEQAHPGIRTIGKACGIKSMNTVTGAIKELEDLGLIAVNREDRKYNIYEIPDYVSANSKTASKNDTVDNKLPQLNDQTASAHRGLTREPENNNHKRGDLIDGYLELYNMPGAKKSARLDSIKNLIGVRLRINPTGRKWEEFCRFADDRMQQDGQDVAVFLTWMTSQKGFDIQYWPPDKMRTMWPQAFSGNSKHDDVEELYPTL